MYISRLVVRNFRNFRDLDIPIQPGVTTLLGENNTGKTNLLHAIRLAVDTSLSSYRRRLVAEDFAAGMDPSTPSQVLVSLEFSDFESSLYEEAGVADSVVEDGLARITFRFRPRRAVRDQIAAGEHPGTGLALDDYHWQITGGGAIDPTVVEWNEEIGVSIRFEVLQQAYLVVAMDALRNATEILRQTRASPLARLIESAEIPAEEQDALVEILREANQRIETESESIENIGSRIHASLQGAAGEASSVNVRVGIASATFRDVARRLTVLLSNQALQDFSPHLNGLGLNNVLHIGMLLEYFRQRVQRGTTAGQLLLVEEPEAHLHPQLQRVLFRELKRDGFQVILSTHSTHMSSQSDLGSLIVLTNEGTPATASVSPFHQTSLSNSHKQDLERYLDATRGELLFARKVLLVEGPAELFLIPALVSSVLGLKLDELGISVVPIYGVHFECYASLFGPTAISKKCAILTDGDELPSDATIEDQYPEDDGSEGAPISRIQTLQNLCNELVEVFYCQTTFEVELTLPGTLSMLAEACAELEKPRAAAKLRDAIEDISNLEDQEAIQGVMEGLGQLVLRTARRIGKARFAQVASRHAERATEIPDYIREAVEWLRIN